MNDYEKGMREYRQMRMGCLLTIGIVLLGLLANKCMSEEDKKYWKEPQEQSELPSIEDPPKNF